MLRAEKKNVRKDGGSGYRIERGQQQYKYNYKYKYRYKYRHKYK